MPTKSNRKQTRAGDLTLDRLLQFDPSGGVMTFAGERVLLLDAVAMGLLRKQLIDGFGLEVARSMLTRFGYAHGWRTAETLKTAIDWESEREWKVAGGRVHRLQGQVSFQPVPPRNDGRPAPFAEGLWPDSYEADQHLLHHGRCAQSVCWTLLGFASGYLSRVNGQVIYCVEESCRGKGDAVCRMVGRARDEWSPAEREALASFETECLDDTLKRLQASLRKVERKLGPLRSTLQSMTDDPSGLVARSQAMREVVTQARRVAAADVPVLIGGESGSGKERVARLIHEASARQAGPFVAINCAAVPESLLESELFGHAHGAFTGALTDRAGLFESARGGTLLLDEVGALPLAVQARLLRVLQEHQVQRVGENHQRPVDLRLLAATQRDLKADVAAGRFREDLYYRLKVVELKVPPLRARPEDIVPLATLALAEAASRAGIAPKKLSPTAQRRVLNHGWPGNVRELQNAMARATVLTAGATIELKDLPDDIARPGPTAGPTSGARTLEDVERAFILSTLEAVGGSRARAAQQLGIGQATLFRKLKQYRAEG